MIEQHILVAHSGTVDHIEFRLVNHEAFNLCNPPCEHTDGVVVNWVYSGILCLSAFVR